MLINQRHHFDSLYTASDDPWGYQTRFSEQRRHALVLAMLDRPSYAKGFEPGCANGVLTAQLAERCEVLDATDASQTAVTLAQAATAHRPNVTLSQADVPRDWPTTTFDLVVLVDFLYYLEQPDIASVCDLAKRSLAGTGTLVVGHWRGNADDFLTPTSDVHLIVRASVGREPDSVLYDRDHLIDLWVQP